MYGVWSMEYVVCDMDRYNKVVRRKQNIPAPGTALVSCIDKEV